jgi:hypothetical protein
MQLQLSNSVNVPAERAKLRKLRDEINESAQARLQHQRRYTARGFLRDMQPLATQERPINGETPPSPLRSAAEVGVSTTAADMRKAQIGRLGCCCGACGVGKQGMTE